MKITVLLLKYIDSLHSKLSILICAAKETLPKSFSTDLQDLDKTATIKVFELNCTKSMGYF